MADIEIPLGKRTKLYRFFEILPGAISIGAIVLLVVLSFLSPLAASLYILLLVLLTFVRAITTAYRTVQGRVVMQRTSAIDWSKRLDDLNHPAKALQKYERQSPRELRKTYRLLDHVSNLRSLVDGDGYPRPNQIVNVVIVALYNESYDVLGPTFTNLAQMDYDIKRRLVVFVAYEQRGGQAALDTVEQIRKHWQGTFRDLVFVEHPAGLPKEVVGKGANLSYTGPKVSEWVRKHRLDSKNVIITTLDSDNKPDKKYFSYLTYEWIMTPNRQQCSFQPICLFNNNLWDVPAPMRVAATSNSFWNVVSSMRPTTLKNFASHSQGLYPLEEMGFWSKRTIVEDDTNIGGVTSFLTEIMKLYH